MAELVCLSDSDLDSDSDGDVQILSAVVAAPASSSSSSFSSSVTLATAATAAARPAADAADNLDKKRAHQSESGDDAEHPSKRMRTDSDAHGCKQPKCACSAWPRPPDTKRGPDAHKYDGVDLATVLDREISDACCIDSDSRRIVAAYLGVTDAPVFLDSFLLEPVHLLNTLRPPVMPFLAPWPAVNVVPLQRLPNNSSVALATCALSLSITRAPARQKNRARWCQSCASWRCGSCSSLCSPSHLPATSSPSSSSSSFSSCSSSSSSSTSSDWGVVDKKRAVRYNPTSVVLLDASAVMLMEFEIRGAIRNVAYLSSTIPFEPVRDEDVYMQSVRGPYDALMRLRRVLPAVVAYIHSIRPNAQQQLAYILARSSVSNNSFMIGSNSNYVPPAPPSGPEYELLQGHEILAGLDFARLERLCIDDLMDQFLLEPTIALCLRQVYDQLVRPLCQLFSLSYQ